MGLSKEEKEEKKKEEERKKEEKEEEAKKQKEEERKKKEEEAKLITHEGWGTKQGHIMKNWKLRWFILKDSTLTYRKEKTDLTFLKALAVDSRCKTTTEFTDPVLLAVEKPMFGFLAGNGVWYYIQTETEEEKKDWIEVLEKVISLNEFVGQSQASAGIPGMPGSGFSHAWANAYMKKHPELLIKEPPACSRQGDLLVLTDIMAMPVKKEKIIEGCEEGKCIIHMCYPGSGSGMAVSFRFHFDKNTISAGVSCAKPVHWVIRCEPGEHLVGGSFQQQGLVGPKHEKRTFDFGEGEWAVYVQQTMMGGYAVTAIEQLIDGKIEQSKLDAQVGINEENEKKRLDELRKMGIEIPEKKE